MTLFRNLSIPKKIVAIIMIISGAALLLSSGALIAYDFSVARSSLRADAMTFARIVAENTNAAISFKDQAAAIDTLNSLRAEPSIVATCIYTPEGLFAEYVTPGTAPCSKSPSPQADAGGIIWVTEPIEWNSKNIGSVQLRATLAPAYAHLRLEMATIIAILIISGLFAYALS